MRALIDSAIVAVCALCVFGALAVSVLVLFGRDVLLLVWLVCITAWLLSDL